jgi:hypothetical protein
MTESIKYQQSAYFHALLSSTLDCSLAFAAAADHENRASEQSKCARAGRRVDFRGAFHSEKRHTRCASQKRESY